MIIIIDKWGEREANSDLRATRTEANNEVDQAEEVLEVRNHTEAMEELLGE